MKKLRKRYHDLANKLNIVALNIDLATAILERAKEKQEPPDVERLLQGMGNAVVGLREAGIELTAVEGIAYKLGNPDEDMDHLLGSEQHP